MVRHHDNASAIVSLHQTTLSQLRRASRRRAACALALVIACAACPASRADVAISEQIIQLGDGLNDLRQENAGLQQQVDSLRLVVAKQDTVIRQLANLAGVPLAR